MNFKIKGMKDEEEVKLETNYSFEKSNEKYNSNITEQEEFRYVSTKALSREIWECVYI